MRMYRNAAALAAVVMLGLAAPSVAFAKNDRNRHNDGPNDFYRTYLNKPLDSSAEDPCTAGFVMQGSGSPNTGFARKRNIDAGVELGLKAILRKGADLPASYVDNSGLVHFEVPAGTYGSTRSVAPDTPRSDIAEWNFNFSVNVGIGGNTATLDDYIVTLWVDLNPGQGQDWQKLRMVKLGAPTMNGACPGASGFGWKAQGGTVWIPDDDGTAQVTQNSQNLGFGYAALMDRLPKIDGVQPYEFGPGQFDVVLVVYKRWNAGGKRNRDKHSDTVLHVVFDVVEGGTAQPDNVGP